MDRAFWAGRSVALTGHTGFKGSWLALWLGDARARVAGLALTPPTTPSLFEAARVAEGLALHRIGDVRDGGTVRDFFESSQPEVVFHLAAQPLVRASYADPLGTYATNVMGTAHVLDAARHTPSVRTVVVITTDKCYENRSWAWGYREIDRLGGHDPYSNSKACAELVTDAYVKSFLAAAGTKVATARAGNVIGGGDWADDRLVPDCVRAFAVGDVVRLRNPGATRPWQHVLEPLRGYLRLAERLSQPGGGDYVGPWNFGPLDADVWPVSDIVARVAATWGQGARWEADPGPHPHEAAILQLDSAKARRSLGIGPVLPLEQGLDWTAAWYRAFYAGDDARALTLADIHRYEERLP